MDRRRLLQRMGGSGAAAATVGLAGCGLLSCGPGDTSIESIANTPTEYESSGDGGTPTEISIRGTIANPQSDQPTVDDTTGTAVVYMGTIEALSQNPSSGMPSSRGR